MAVAVVMAGILAFCPRLRQEALPSADRPIRAFNLSSPANRMIQAIVRFPKVLPMRRSAVAIALTAAVVCTTALVLGLPTSSPVARSNQAVFLVPADDGYGFAECLTSGAACGRIVADSWCETQGYARALTYELAAPEDVTGALHRASPASKPQAVAITCAQ